MLILYITSAIFVWIFLVRVANFMFSHLHFVWRMKTLEKEIEGKEKMEVTLFGGGGKWKKVLFVWKMVEMRP